MIFAILVLVLIRFPFPAMGAENSAVLDAEVKRINALASDTDTELLVVGAMAELLKTHRDHLMLLRRQTGQSYGEIFVSLLASAGNSEEEILRQFHLLHAQVEASLNRPETQNPDAEGAPIQPALYLYTGANRNSARSFYYFTPEAGIETQRISFYAGIPMYRYSNSQSSGAGIGDAYLSVVLQGTAQGVHLSSFLAARLPTGDADRGLGAGKATFDASVGLRRPLRNFAPFLTAGFTNFVFGNVGYQRPYITTGNTAYFSGGLDIELFRRLTAGASGFALRPVESQTVFSQATAPGGSSTPSGGMHGGMMGGGVLTGSISPVVVSSNDLQDHGVAGWISYPLHRTVSLNFNIARSFPFELTTVRFGMGLDLGRLLFPGKNTSQR